MFDFSCKIPGVFKYIPRVELPKYTNTLIHINTVCPHQNLFMMYIFCAFQMFKRGSKRGYNFGDKAYIKSSNPQSSPPRSLLENLCGLQGRIQSKISEGVVFLKIVCVSRKRSFIARRRRKNFNIWYVYVGKGAS